MKKYIKPELEINILKEDIIMVSRPDNIWDTDEQPGDSGVDWDDFF